MVRKRSAGKARLKTKRLRPWVASLPMKRVFAETKPKAIRAKTGRMVMRIEDIGQGRFEFTMRRASLSCGSFVLSRFDQANNIHHDPVQIEVLGRIDAGDAQLLKD